MKRLIVVIAIALFTTTAFAQKSKTVSAFNYFKHQELQQAQEAIDEAIEHSQTKEDAKTWYYRGMIYHAIYTTGSDTMAGQQELLEKYPDALDKAAESFEKTKELDHKGTYEENLQQFDALIARDYFNVAARQYTDKEYEAAAETFEKYIDALKITNANVIDTNAIFYTAQSYYVSENNQKAKQYLNRLQELQYNDPWIYMAMYEMQMGEKDTSAALSTIEKGRKAFPEDKNLAVYEVNLYLAQGKLSELTDKLEETKELDPENVSIYTTLATVYQQLGNNEAALDNYRQALELDSESFEANYGMGASHYNKGVNVRDKSLEEKDKKKQADMEAEFKDEFKKALPYFEKAHKIRPDDKEVIQNMLTIYILLGNEKKAEELNQKLKG